MVGTVGDSPSASNRFQAYVTLGTQTSYYGDGYSNQSGTFGTAISDLGFAVGSAYVTQTFGSSNSHGLIFPPPHDPNNPNQTVLNAPGASGSASYDGTFPQGINDSNTIVGYYSTSTYGPNAGFIYQSGVYTTFNVPGVYNTQIFGINNSGDMVGEVDTSTPGEQGFVDIGGQISIVTYPGSENSIVTGINDSGEIVGDYFINGDSSYTPHGFLATPIADTLPTDVPEPRSFLLVGTGVCLCIVVSNQTCARKTRKSTSS